MRIRKVTLISLSSVIVAACAAVVLAATNIDSVNRYAWDDVNGWWDFYSTDTVYVGTSSLYGYATSTIGALALNCDSTPIGNICATSNFKVCNGDWDGTNCVNTGSSKLNGCAWNDQIGWVSFNCESYDCQGTGGAHSICAQSNYGVEIDANGYFGGIATTTGWAWNDVVGWIKFSDFLNSVQTTWREGRLVGYLESSILDTQIQRGSTLNSIIWQGWKSTDAPVDFQIAASDSAAGPWNFIGPDGTSASWYGNKCPIIAQGNTSPNEPICIDGSQIANYRYIRYKIRLQSNPGQSTTSLVTDIILNFSR